MTISPRQQVGATATATYPETDLTRGVKELWDALPEYERAENYYEGNVDETFASPLIERYLARSRNKYRLNFIKTTINVIADRLEISSITVPDDEKLTRLLNRIAKKNRMHRKARTIHHRVPMFGDAYLFVWPETPDSPTIKFEVHYNSPKTTRAIYSRELPDRVAFVIKMWREPSPLGPMTWRANLYYPDQTEKWIQRLDNSSSSSRTTQNAIYPGAEHQPLQDKEAPSLDSKRWEPTTTPIDNPYHQIPIFHFRNDEPYGKPRHKDAYGAQDAINKLSTTLVHTADFQGFPQRYGLADPDATIGGNDENIDWDDDEDSTTTGSGESGIESGPGTFIRLEGIRAAGSFPAAQPDAFMDPAKFYLRSMAQITNTPVRFFDPLGEPPSGEALRAMDAPLNKEALDLHDILEETWADVYEFQLAVLGQVLPIDERPAPDPLDPDGDIQVDIQWAPVFSIDDAIGWDMVQKKIRSGVPTKQALIEAGYSEPQVDAWLASNENKAVLRDDTDTMSRIAASARDFQGAVQQGYLDPEIVQHVLTKHLSRLLDEKLKEPPVEEPTIVSPTDPNPNDTPSEGEEDDGHEQRPTAPPNASENGGSATAEAVRRLTTISNRQP